MARAIGAEAPGSAAPPVVQVRFVADLVCPWCFISFRRLHRLVRGAAVEVAWHPFLLNPHLPPGGVARSHYLERKFGSAAQAQRLHARLLEVGAREGLRFAFAAIRTQPSTVLAHALILGAAEAGLDPLPAAQALFSAFFERGQDIGELPTLRAIARRAGLPSVGLEDPAFAARVLAAHESACGFGINGVPICVFGQDHVIAGAQPLEALAALLDLERYRVAGAPAA
jgi:predicted DsbA family dithiol-disulfide isomerase